MKAILASLSSLGVVAAVALQPLPRAAADTVYLKNGSVIHGKLVADPNVKDASRIVFSGGGSMTVANADIARSVPNDRDDVKDRPQEGKPVPAADTGREKKLLRVTLKRDKNDFYGRGSYVGWEGTSDDASMLVLELPGGGELRIPRAQVEASVEIDLVEAGLKPAVVPDSRSIKTTHRLTLKNGRVILGNLEPSPANEPLKIRVGELGVLRFDRDSVEKLEEAAGTYEVPAPSEEPIAPKEKSYDIPPEVIEALKKELRREIIRELLEGIIDEKIDEKLDSALEDARSADIRLPLEPLPPEQILEAQYHVRELCRQRSQNRVRAEAHLKRLGAGALAYLGPAAGHSFELTRRAVQRIVRDIGDHRGAPLAIDGLNDPDLHVRQLSHEALRRLLDAKLNASISYDPQGPEVQRLAAQEKYREAWLDLARSEVKETLATRARSMLAE
jgi:hypothetical protein